jgi:Rrf2 family protein
MLKISDAVNLGFHAMMILATEPDARPLTVASMARRLGLSENHLAKVMQRLQKEQLVSSKRGPRGGFTLGRPAGEIRLLEIYEAIDGPLPVSGCLLETSVCDGSCCLLGGLLGSISTQVRDHLSNTTLAQVSAGFSDRL